MSMGQAPSGQGYGVQSGQGVPVVQQSQPVPDRQFLAVQEAILDELIESRRAHQAILNRVSILSAIAVLQVAAAVIIGLLVGAASG